MGYNKKEIYKFNMDAIKLLEDIRSQNNSLIMPISACLGPYGDGYEISEKLTSKEAQNYHSEQISTIAKSNADLVTAFTLSYEEEAIGIVNASREHNIPIVIGFTLETDGKLPSGQTLKSAIENVDKQTDNYSSYYMVNCVHPVHFNDILSFDESWKLRIRSIRANASKKSHKELDEAEHLDQGDPIELAHLYKELKGQLKNLNVIGGCCGTDHHHIEIISKEISSKKLVA